MFGFVIAIMLCSGSNCDLVQPEPDTSYQSYAECNAALAGKAADLKAMADQRASADRPARIVCLHPLETIVEVEQPHDVLDTAIVHKEPSATSLFVGIVEKDKRTLVTGLVSGTGWVRVLLPDGKSGFVFADRLRRVGQPSRAASVTALADAGAPPPNAAVAPAPTPPVVSPLPAAPAAAPPPPQIAVAQPPPMPASSSPAASPVPPPSVAPAPTGPSGATASPGASPLGRGEFRDCPTCPIMMTIPGGSFDMGSNEDYSERPPHRVAVRPFALAKFELTVTEWDACVTAGVCAYKPPDEASPDRRPMTNLSWADAGQYLQWLQKTTGKPYRLPSEAEWEYAAAAGTTTRYSWGEQVGVGKADCKGCGNPGDGRQPADVGSFAANAWGLHGMQGGVAEWVADCWHTWYKDAPADGTAWQSPHCPSHVLRGGSWMNPPGDISIRNRNFYDANVRYVANGMRVALTLH